MNEKAIALTAFFMTLFILGQIRFILKIRRMRRSSDNLPGVLYLGDVMGLCCAAGECAACFGEAAVDEQQASQQIEPTAAQKALRRKFDKWQPEGETNGSDEIEYVSLPENEEKKKVKAVITGSRNASLGWVVHTVKIRKERIIEIVLDDPNFILEDDFIIDLRMLTEAELEEKEMKERIRKMSEDERATKQICPECNNLAEKTYMHCPTCGNEF